MNLNMQILCFAYIFLMCSAVIIGERKRALGGSFHCSIGYDIFPSLLRRLISTQAEENNDTADISADRIIAQSCPNPYCVCASFPYDYTTAITSAVFVYATSNRSGGSRARTPRILVRDRGFISSPRRTVFVDHRQSCHHRVAHHPQRQQQHRLHRRRLHQSYYHHRRLQRSHHQRPQQRCSHKREFESMSFYSDEC